MPTKNVKHWSFTSKAWGLGQSGGFYGVAMSPSTTGSKVMARPSKAYAPALALGWLKWMKCTLTLAQKNYCRIWVAVDRYGKRFLHCVLGSRGTKTGKKPWEAVQSNTITNVTGDHWGPYGTFIPSQPHTQSKAETYAVEGYNSLFRHLLARLRRKSKRYSKSQEMLEYSVMLLMLKWNGDLETIFI